MRQRPPVVNDHPFPSATYDCGYQHLRSARTLGSNGAWKPVLVEMPRDSSHARKLPIACRDSNEGARVNVDVPSDEETSTSTWQNERRH